jgi:VanZ family protein
VEKETALLQAWLLVLVWTVIIIVESVFGSAANTGWLLQELSRWAFGYLDRERFAVWHHILRKTGHFVGYGICGYLWFRALVRTCTKIRLLSCAAIAVAISFLTASLDEWHQSFSPGRTSQFSDVVLDTSGAFVLVLLALIAMRMPRSASEQ